MSKWGSTFARRGNPVATAGFWSATKLRRRRLLAIPAALLLVVALFSVLVGASSAAATCTIYWKGATSNQWNAPTNWVNATGGAAGHVPGSSDFVCMSSLGTNGVTPSNTAVQLPSGTVTITGINWSQISGSNPSLEVDGTLKLGDATAANASTINSLTVISGGVLASAVSSEAVSVGTLTAAGTLEGPGTITATGASTLNSVSLGVSGAAATVAHLIVQGTMTALTGTPVYFYDGSQIEVQSPGTLTLNDSAYLVNEDGKATNQLVVDSGGVVSYTGSSSGQTATVGVPTTGAGTFSVGVGTLVLGGGTVSGGSDAATFSAAAGAAIDLQGTRKAGAGMTITGAGTVDLQGTEVFSGSQTVTDNGQWQIDGTLQGPATTTVSGTGSLVLNSLSLGVSAAADAMHLISQVGATVPAGSPVYFYDGSQFENQSTLTLNDSAYLVNEDGKATNQLVVDSGGVVSYTGSSSGQTATVGVPTTGAGTFSVGVGTLVLGGGTVSGGSDAATFSAAAGAAIDLQGTRKAGAGMTITGAGTVDLQGTEVFSGSQTVTDNGQWQIDGTLQGPATTTVSGTGSLVLNSLSLGVSAAADAMHLISQVGATVPAGSPVYFYDGSQFENQSTLTLNDSANLVNEDGNANTTLVNDSGATISFAGSTSAQNAYIQVPLTNNGSVVVTKATLQATAGGTAAADTGSFSAASGATLDLNGSRSEGSGAAMAGAGTIDLQGTTTFASGATVTNTGTFQVDGAVVVPSGVTLAVSNLTANGTVEGPGTVSVSGPATLNSPTLGVYGTPGDQVHLIVKGQTTLTGTVYFTDGSELENQGTITPADNSNLYNYDGNTGNEIVNDSGATISYTGSTSAQNAYIQVPLTNNGSVVVTKATLQATAGGTAAADTGSFSAASGATLDLNGSRSEGSGAAMAGAGTIDLQGTTTFASGATVTNTGTFQVDGAVVVPSGVTLAVSNLTANGTVEGPGTVSVSGPATLNSPTLGVYGTPGDQVHLIVKGQTTLTGTVYFTDGSELENQGTITPADNSNLYNYDGNTGNEIVNDSGATISYTGSTSAQNAYIQVPLTNNGALNANRGILNVSSLTNLDGTGVLTGGTYSTAGGVMQLPNGITTNGASVTLGTNPSSFKTGSTNALASIVSNTGSLDLKQSLSLTGAVANSGTVTVESGTLSSPTGYSQSAGATTVAGGATLKPGTNGAAISAGSLAGTGAINGKLSGGGNITPAGAVAGPMTVSSTFSNNSGTLTIPVSGATTAGTDYGQLSATGAATVSGTLAISTASGYLPPDGTAYTVVKGSSLTGTFSTVTGATLADRKYVISYTPTSVVATVHYFPIVSGLSPSSGPAAGGPAGSVTITGQHFTGATGVSFGATAATSFSVVDDSHITVTPPAGSGTVDVTVTTPGGTSPTESADQYTFVPAPAAAGVSPTSGPATGSTSVTITGSHFTGASAVSFGSAAAASFTVNNDGQITAAAPAGTGTVDVTVTTAGGTSATSSSDHFGYIPVVSGISPATGPAAGATSVTISGAGFTGATSVSFGTTAAASFTVNNDGQINASSPAGTGTVDVTVTTPTGTSAVTPPADQFTYQPASSGPAVSGLNPSAGPTTAGTVVQIAGSGFTGATAVSFGGTAAVSFTVNSDSQVTATAPAHATGPVDVRVTTPSGTSPISQPADVYTYESSPTVVSIKSAAVGPLAGGNTVTVNGTNFVAGATVTFGANPGTNVTIVSSKLLTVTVPGATTAGSVDITVTTPGGTSKKSVKDLYAYGAPTISAFTPSSGITGSKVQITGSGFAAGVGVSFGSLKSATVTIVSGTSLTATVPNGDATPSAIKVSDTQGSQSSATQFTPTMAITSFSPTSGSKSAGTVVAINGIGFSSNSVVAFNKTNAATTFVSSTQLTAVLPSTASTGLITVTSPGADIPSGTVTSVAKFTVNP